MFSIGTVVSIGIICWFVGGITGTVLMALMNAASISDDELLGVKQYENEETTRT
jgi:hypothetical protein